MHQRELSAVLLACVLAMAGWPDAGAGTLYKCVTREGKTAFQDSPCQAQSRSEVVSRDGPAPRSGPPRPAAAAPSNGAPDTVAHEPKCAPPPDLKNRSSLSEHRQWTDMLLRLLETTSSFRAQEAESAPAFGEVPRTPNACSVLGKRYLALKRDIEAMSPYQFSMIRSCLLAREQALADEKKRLGCR